MCQPVPRRTPTVFHYLVEFQEYIERGLGKSISHCLLNMQRQVGEHLRRGGQFGRILLVVERSVLSCQLQPIQSPPLTHLIVDHRLSKSLNELCHHLGIFTLIYESGHGALRQQRLRLFLDLF